MKQELFSVFSSNSCLKPAALSARIVIINLGEKWGIITCGYSPAATLPPRAGRECAPRPAPSDGPAEDASVSRSRNERTERYESRLHQPVHKLSLRTQGTRQMC